MSSCEILQPEKMISVSQRKDMFFSLKTNKNPGYGDINFDR